MRSSILTLIDEAPALQPPRRDRTLALRLRAGQPQSSLSPGQQAFEIVLTDFSIRLQETSAIANSHPRRRSPFRIQSQNVPRRSATPEYYLARDRIEKGSESFCSSRGCSSLPFLRNGR